MSYSLSFTKTLLVVNFVCDKIRRKQFDYLSTSTLSGILSIREPTLVRILQRLAVVGIIDTKVGRNGVLRLVKDRAGISALVILDTIEKGKSLFNTSFGIKAKGQRPDKAQHFLLSLFYGSESRKREVLERKTVAQIPGQME